MPNLPVPSAVVFVSDVARTAAFYRELASMRELHVAADHAVLEIEGLQLVVHALRGEPDPADAGRPPRVREDAYVKLCFPVASLADARARASALGGFVKDPSAEWEARGFRACDGHDPEGNVIQVREPAPAI